MEEKHHDSVVTVTVTVTSTKYYFMYSKVSNYLGTY